ncbi:hypothetical protein MRS44_010782 [Fusarium solani]|uniref:C2 domain-containing protein n=1 Tax=Fusarium solani TaxID=169388 RepID=A0A9P9GY91_FUSSL|nr:uncharacterized protein B0J15DRAFT_563090 [Fusarium solani]KAH7247744.1 hypothetical protein B0J15DRAFT_563090 [Fusarium solani]KAJ3462229.1 hypothetical protein MRS44_010782 [Fusarium solani]
MMYLVAFVAWLVWIFPVQATAPNVGWRATIIASQILAIPEFLNQHERVLDVRVPIAFHRVASKADSFTLDLYTSSYYPINETSYNRTSVYTEVVQATSANPEFEQTFRFSVSTTGWEDLLILVNVEDGSDGRYSVETGGAILFYNREQEWWAGRNVSEHAYHINNEIVEERKAIVPMGIDNVTVAETKPTPGVYVPVDHMEPKEKNETTPSVPSTTPSPIVVPSTVPPNLVVSTNPGASYTPIPERPSVPVQESIHQSQSFPPSKCEPVTETVYHTVTVYAEHSPSFACSCDSKYDKKSLDTRDDIVPAYVKAKFTFTDRWGRTMPLRHLVIIAYADLFSQPEGYRVGPWSSIAFTDVNGEATFTFSIGKNHKIVTNTLYVILRGEHYTIGTRRDETEDFVQSEIRKSLAKQQWTVLAGETIEVTVNFEDTEYNRALWVADAYEYLSSYVKEEIANRDGELTQVQIWYPAPSSGAFFSDATADPVYISIPDSQSEIPATMGHEYGHFIHYLARMKATLFAGGVHNFCNLNDLTTTSISEGYASALGLMALYDTPLVDGKYFQYAYRWHDGLGNVVVVGPDLENYSCDKRKMSYDEGRIAAALIDLVDPRIDEYPTEDSDIGHIAPDFNPELHNFRLTPRLVFWRAMATNPHSISQYWYDLQWTLTEEKRKQVWSVFEYNWADFPVNGETTVWQ